MEGQIPAPLINAHDIDALINEPLGRWAAHASAALPIFTSPLIAVTPRFDQGNHAGLKDSACLQQTVSQIVGTDGLAFLFVGHVKDYPRSKTYVQRHFVNG